MCKLKEEGWTLCEKERRRTIFCRSAIHPKYLKKYVSFYVRLLKLCLSLQKLYKVLQSLSIPYFFEDKKDLKKMNAQEFLKLLKKWNGGITRGSQRNFAKKLSIAESSIANFIKGRQSPSEKLLKEMAKILSTSEDNLQKIFDLSGSNNTFGNNSPVHVNYNEQLEKELKLKDERIKFLQEQVDFYKSKCKK